MFAVEYSPSPPGRQCKRFVVGDRYTLDLLDIRNRLCVIMVDEKKRIRGQLHNFDEYGALQLLKRVPAPILDVEIVNSLDTFEWRDMRLTITGSVIWRDTASYVAWNEKHGKSYHEG